MENISPRPVTQPSLAANTCGGIRGCADGIRNISTTYLKDDCNDPGEKNDE